ncbi:hypothetical protein SLE2022_079490 [Rubroshorea leprosula]
MPSVLLFIFLLILSQPPTFRRRLITILCIDGGRVIPESELQKLDGEEARLADCCDVTAGTSTGDLGTAMLTAPTEKNQP